MPRSTEGHHPLTIPLHQILECQNLKGVKCTSNCSICAMNVGLSYTFEAKKQMKPK